MRRILNTASVILILCNIILLAQEKQTEVQKFKDEMRSLWKPDQEGFIKQWLVLGEFPNLEGKGLDIDYLGEHGGEKRIYPVEGMQHTRPDSSIVKWKKFESDANTINFLEAFRGRQTEHVVGYAFTVITSQEDSNVLLSFGSDDGIKIWLNGKQVFRKFIGRSIKADEDLIEVFMPAGENKLLVKVEQALGDWGFCLRMVTPELAMLLRRDIIAPSIDEEKSNNETLVIRNDATISALFGLPQVHVKIIAAGGRVAASETAHRGSAMQFNTNNWEEGIYEILFFTTDSKGLPLKNYLFWYKGNPLEAAQKLVSTVPPKAETQNELVHIMLAEMVNDRLGGKLDGVTQRELERIYSPLMEFAELQQTEKSKAGNIRPGGFVRLAYRDEIDDSPQLCRAYLPPDYVPNKKWPMVVNLHGYNPENPDYIHWWFVDWRHNNMSDRHNVIYIEPHGRGNTGYLGIGDRDVLKCIQLAKESLSVDENRVYLTGSSMGGGGTWHVGTRHPELFAAIAPIYGGWDYHVSMDEEALSKLSDRDRFFQERASSFVQAEALLTTPVFVHHGDEDTAVDVDFSRYATRMMQRWGYNIRYWEVPGLGHVNLGTDDELMQWFLEHKREVDPKRVRIRAADLKHASAHWVKVTQRENQFDLISVDAQLIGENVIRLDTKNVLEIIFSPSNTLVDINKPVQIFWNTDDRRIAKIKGNQIVLRARNYKPNKLIKTPEIEGTISDFTNTPFAVIIGTISKDSLMRKLCSQKAEEFVNYWKEWQRVKPRVFKDTEFPESEISKYSLLLYGGAEANQITKKLADKLPLNVSSEEIEIDGRAFKVKDAAVNLIYPHPLNTKRYVSIITATSGAGLYFINPYRNVGERYDYYIVDGRIPNRRRGRPVDKIRIAAGVFDYNWQINDKYLEVGDSELRVKSPYKKVNPDLSTTIEGLPEIDPAIYDTYAGEYGKDGMLIRFWRDGKKLMVQGPNGTRFELYPDSETGFFLDVIDIQFDFIKDEEGKVTEVLIYQGNQETRVKKIN